MTLRRINDLAVAAAMLMAIAFSFSFALFNIGVATLIVCFFLKRILEKNFRFFDLFSDGALFFYYGAAVLSLIQTEHLGMALQGLQKLIRYLLLFIAAREVFRTRRELEKVAGALLLGAAIAALDVLGQFILGEDLLAGRTPFLSFGHLIRLTGPFHNPNAMAIYFCFFIFLVYLVWSLKWRRGWFGALLVLMLGAVAMSYSRPAALSLAVSGIFICIAAAAWWIPLLGGAAAVLGYFAAPPAVTDWLSKLPSWQSFFSDVSRSFHHQAAWNMIKAHPWSGVGINTFDVNYANFKAAEDSITRWSAHQAYLQIWAETGILGLLGFLIILAAVVRLGWKGYQAARDLFLKRFLLGMAAGILCFLIIGFFESNLWQPRQTYFFWFYAGLFCCLAQGMRQGSYEKTLSD